MIITLLDDGALEDRLVGDGGASGPWHLRDIHLYLIRMTNILRILTNERRVLGVLTNEKRVLGVLTNERRVLPAGRADLTGRTSSSTHAVSDATCFAPWPPSF